MGGGGNIHQLGGQHPSVGGGGGLKEGVGGPWPPRYIVKKGPVLLRISLSQTLRFCFEKATSLATTDACRQ